MNYNILNKIADKIEMRVYIVFEAHCKGMLTEFYYLSIHTSLEGAYESAKKEYDKNKFQYKQKCHKDMDNNYIYIGRRCECIKVTNFLTMCGYIIEETIVDK